MRLISPALLAVLVLSGCVSVPSQCGHLSDGGYHRHSDDLRAVCARAEIAEDYQDTMLLLIGIETLLGIASE